MLVPVSMAAWGAASPGRAPGLASIMGQQAEDEGDADLQRALRESALAAPVDTPVDSELEEALRLSAPEDGEDASVALALQLREQDRMELLDAARLRERRAALARHEKVRVGEDDGDDDVRGFPSVKGLLDDDDDDDDEGMRQLLEVCPC